MQSSGIISEEAPKPRGRVENLKPFKPGQSGNPKGKPKGVLNFKTRLEMATKILAEKFATDFNTKYAKGIKAKQRKAMRPEDVDILGDIFLQYVNKARSGDLKAIDSLLDRAYGKAVQPLKHSGDAENPIEHSLRVDKSVERAAAMLKRFGLEAHTEAPPPKPVKKAKAAKVKKKRVPHQHHGHTRTQ